MAEFWERGELPLDTDFVNESFVGSRFVGRLIGETEVGDHHAVIPTIAGHGWLDRHGAAHPRPPLIRSPTSFEF